MNTKLLASIAVFALLSGVVSTAMMQPAYAADETVKEKAKAMKEEAKAMKEEAKAKAKAMKEETKTKAKAMKEEAKTKAKAMKEETKAQAKAMKEEAKAKAKAMKEETKTKAKAMKEEAKTKAKAMKEEAKATGAGTTTKVTVEMAKDSANPDGGCDVTNTCYNPGNAQVAVGGSIMWKNVDSAAHTATASDGSFDSQLVNAGKTFTKKFEAAGTFDYFCLVHPWMKGTVTVS